MSSIIKTTIDKKLRATFTPSSLEVINESHMHAGHHHDGGEAFDPSGESHFRIKITSSEFNNMTRVDIHRAINALLSDELSGTIHALAIEAKAN